MKYLFFFAFSVLLSASCASSREHAEMKLSSDPAPEKIEWVHRKLDGWIFRGVDPLEEELQLLFSATGVPVKKWTELLTHWRKAVVRQGYTQMYVIAYSSLEDEKAVSLLADNAREQVKTALGVSSSGGLSPVWVVLGEPPERREEYGQLVVTALVGDLEEQTQIVSMFNVPK